MLSPQIPSGYDIVASLEPLLNETQAAVNVSAAKDVYRLLDLIFHHLSFLGRDCRAFADAVSFVRDMLKMYAPWKMLREYVGNAERVSPPVTHDVMKRLCRTMAFEQKVTTNWTAVVQELQTHVLVPLMQLYPS